MALLERYLKDDQFARLLAQEELILEMTETLCELLQKENITRQALAERLGKSKGFVSQVLNGGRNLTLRTIADILNVLGYKIKINPYKKDSGEKGCRTLSAHFWGQQYSHTKVRWEPDKISIPDNYFDQLAV